MLPGGTSPLGLLSPNAGPRAAPARTTKAVAGSAVAAAAAPQPPALPASPRLPSDGEPGENDPLGDLPQFGGGHRGGRRPDARRQSLAIGAMFAGLTASEGLLGDNELTVGDEEIQVGGCVGGPRSTLNRAPCPGHAWLLAARARGRLSRPAGARTACPLPLFAQVPLAKSGKLLGGATNHSHLWVDPDTHDLLEAQLPSPQLPSPLLAGAGAGARPPAAPAGGADADVAAADTPTPPPTRLRDQLLLQQQQWEAAQLREARQQQQQPAQQQDDPMLCDSPVVAPAARAAAMSTRKTPAGARPLRAARPLPRRALLACQCRPASSGARPEPDALCPP